MVQLPGCFKPPEPDQSQRALLHDPAGQRPPAAHRGVCGAAALRHSGCGERWNLPGMIDEFSFIIDRDSYGL